MESINDRNQMGKLFEIIFQLSHLIGLIKGLMGAIHIQVTAKNVKLILWPFEVILLLACIFISEINWFNLFITTPDCSKTMLIH